MTRSVQGLCSAAGLVAAMCIGWSISAQAERSSCADCNRPIANTKVSTSYKYKTVQRLQNVTRYKA